MIGQPPRRPLNTRRDIVVAAGCGFFAAAMVGAAYAAVLAISLVPTVPLFCFH